jgi:hypothetical protein
VFLVCSGLLSRIGGSDAERYWFWMMAVIGVELGQG